MKMLYYDTMVFQPLYLRHLVEVVGVDHVLLGTDFPFDMSETDPIGLINATDGLDDTERAAIAGANAVRLFQID
jgi:aminocarboxymuconate-semialdehyde decarboxylase